MKNYFAGLWAGAFLFINAVGFANVPSAQLDYTIQTQGLTLQEANGIGNYAYIKLAKPQENQKLNNSLEEYTIRMEKRIGDVLTDVGIKLQAVDKEHKELGHFESLINVTRADNLLLSFEEQTVVWAVNAYPLTETRYYNFDSQSGNRIDYVEVFSDEILFARMVAEQFAKNNPEHKLKDEPIKYFIRLLRKDNFIFTGTGIKIITDEATGIPLTVEIPYEKLSPCVSKKFIPLDMEKPHKEKTEGAIG